MDDSTASVARRVWTVVEPYHAVVYFAPEHRATMDALGLRGGWMAYFASRAAPLGPICAEVVAALFYNFHPSMVGRALPDAWSHATTHEVLKGRTEAVDRALLRLLDPDLLAVVTQAAPLARRAAQAAELPGRPMFAANAALDWPDAPHVVLWHATTLLREHRGDGHVATLVSEGIDGCEAHLLQVAARRNPRSGLQPYRGWSDTEWDLAAQRLRGRGLLNATGGLTSAGDALVAHVEGRTDRLAADPYIVLGDRIERLLGLMEHLAGVIRRAGAVPYPNPMGVPVPDND